MIGYAEPTLKLKSSEFNDFDVMLCDKIIAYDHLKQKITVIVNMKTNDLENQYNKAINDIDEIVKMINDPTPVSKLTSYKDVEFKSNFTEEEYADTVIMLHRPVYYGITEDEYGNSLIDTAEIIVLKNRNGITGDLNFNFNKEIPRFEEFKSGSEIVFDAM